MAHNFPAVRLTAADDESSVTVDLLPSVGSGDDGHGRVVVAGDLTDGGAHTPGHRSAVRSVLTGERVGVRRGFLRG